MDIQLGRSRTVRRAYGIDEIALVPGGRTVDPTVTDSSWTLGGITREIPIIASAMDGVVDVGMCVELAKQGALGPPGWYLVLESDVRVDFENAATFGSEPWWCRSCLG